MKRITILMLAMVFSFVSFAQNNGGVPYKTASATISNVSISGTNVTFTVTPNSDVTSWYFQIWKANRLEDECIEYGGNLNENFWWYNDYYGETYAEQFATPHTGTETITEDYSWWVNLVPGETGQIYVLCFGANGDTTTVSTTFTLEAIGGTGTPAVTTTVNASCNDVVFSTEMNSEVASYTISLFSVETFTEYPEYNNADSMYSIGNKYYTDFTDASFSGISAGNYVFWVVAANQNGYLVGQSYNVTIEETYSIGEPEFSANDTNTALVDAAFDITLDEDCIANYGVAVDYDGTMASYINLYMQYFGYSFSQAAAAVVGEIATETVTTSPVTITAEGLQPVTNYYVFFGFETTSGSTIYDYVDITTPIFQGGDGEAVATLTVNSVGHTSATVSLSMNEDTKLVYVIYGATDLLNDNNITDCASAFQYASDHNMYVVEELVNYTISGLDEGESYTMYAIPVNANDEQGQCQTVTWTTTEMPELLTWTTPILTQTTDSTFSATFTVTTTEACDKFGVTWDYDVEETADYYGLSALYVLDVYITNENGWYNATPNQPQTVVVEGLYAGEEALNVYILAITGTDSTYYEIPVSTLTSGINEVESSLASMRIYPNPTTENATLSISGLNESATVVVCDMQGRTISSEKIAAGTTNTTINTANLESGIYYVRVVTANATRTEKLIKR